MQDKAKVYAAVPPAWELHGACGTNLALFMVARGWQPISPNKVDLIDEEEALLTGPSFDEHNKAPVKNLEIATRLVTQAREAVCGVAGEPYQVQPEHDRNGVRTG